MFPFRNKSRKNPRWLAMGAKYIWIGHLMFFKFSKISSAIINHTSDIIPIRNGLSLDVSQKCCSSMYVGDVIMCNLGIIGVTCNVFLKIVMRCHIYMINNTNDKETFAQMLSMYSNLII